jgi:hypothetical protein
MSSKTASPGCCIGCESSRTAPLYRTLRHLQNPVSELIHADSDFISPLFKLVLLVLRVLPYFRYCRHCSPWQAAGIWADGVTAHHPGNR